MGERTAKYFGDEAPIRDSCKANFKLSLRSWNCCRVSSRFAFGVLLYLSCLFVFCLGKGIKVRTYLCAVKLVHRYVGLGICLKRCIGGAVILTYYFLNIEATRIGWDSWGTMLVVLGRACNKSNSIPLLDVCMDCKWAEPPNKLSRLRLQWREILQ